MSRLNDSIESLGVAQMFTELEILRDIAKCQSKTRVTTSQHLPFSLVPTSILECRFGGRNAPATFQRTLDNIQS